MLLKILFSLSILSILIFLFLNQDDFRNLNRASLLHNYSIVGFSGYLLYMTDMNSQNFQHTFDFSLPIQFMNISIRFGIDGMSALFLFLNSLLIAGCLIWISKDYNKQLKIYSISLLILELFLIIIFSTLDMFIFYVFFEAVLIPMFLIIGFGGSRARKIRALYLFFYYTFISSILMLIVLFSIYNSTGTLNYEQILSISLTKEEQILYWIPFFLAFATKIPLFPFHIWLPEVHVEAPTIGSVLLAGILLKLGVYGLIKFNLFLLPYGSYYFSPFMFILGIFGVIYASLNAIRQTDLKRIIAYSSVAHMSLIVIGIFSFNDISLIGAIIQSVSHGFVSAALFFLIGALYARYHTRNLHDYSGIVAVMPIYTSFFLLFTFGNIALPGTSSFIGEFILLCGIFSYSHIGTFLAALGIILCGIYSLWLANKMLFGNLATNSLQKFQDLEPQERQVMYIFVFYMLILGVYPTMFIQTLSYNI